MKNKDRRGGLDRNSIRPVHVECGFHKMAEGSALYQCGNTRVLCTASIDETVPDWMKGRGVGWLTAEYQMHPRSNPKRREKRDGRERPLGGRAREIQRLIGRGLRAAIDLKRLGERSIVIDCDVLEADGGTRTASVTGGFIALCLALHELKKRKLLSDPVIADQVAAISVGHVDGQLALDLCYEEDKDARVDLNLIGTSSGNLVEIQGTAEGRAVPRSEIDQMVDLGLQGITALCQMQKTTLRDSGVELETLMIQGP